MQHTTLHFVIMSPWSPQICDIFSVFPYFVISCQLQSLAPKNKTKKQSQNVCCLLGVNAFLRIIFFNPRNDPGVIAVLTAALADEVIDAQKAEDVRQLSS